MERCFIGVLTGLLILLWPTIALSASARATFTSACQCTHCKGHDRWTEKTDTASPPSDPTPKKPSDLAAWDGPNVPIIKQGDGEKRLPDEERWYKVTGQVTLVRAEGDGDLHVQLIDVGAKNNSKSRKIVVEIPSNTATKTSNPWCQLRRTVFGWTSQTFPFTSSDKLLTLTSYPIITVVGKAFYDTDHAPAGNKDNTRIKPKEPDVSVWEIHPVMKLTVNP